MNDLEYILDFVVNLGGKMLGTGANLERVNDTMNRICLSYNLNNISIFSLSKTIIISAKSSNNIPGTRQIAVPRAVTHLEKLKCLNQLSRDVCENTPPPQSLSALLEEAENVKEYPLPIVILGYMIALTSMCGIYGGSFGDMLSADLITIILFYVTRLLGRPYLNRIISNALCMWVAGSLAAFFVFIGIGKHYPIIIITNSLMILPGIPLVNAVRNIFCGNEMNGILEILKVILETMAIVAGLCTSIYMFGGLVQW